ncbi:unnamed protein product [Rangifer tarandus platyrhynchus]|uniref:Uncharacterized protein n=1 Tax=Rangifer tarandus platyrhynchus TaxID=3082113 RepID=A0ACB1KHH2_RANTA
MATHSSILAWRIPWTEEPGGLQSMGSQESDMTEQQNHLLAEVYLGGNAIETHKEQREKVHHGDHYFECGSSSGTAAAHGCVKSSLYQLQVGSCHLLLQRSNQVLMQLLTFNIPLKGVEGGEQE